MATLQSPGRSGAGEPRARPTGHPYDFGMFRPGQHAPATYLRPGQQWPEGALDKGAPAEAVRTRRLAMRLQSALLKDGLSIRQAAAQCGVSHPTLVRLLNGSSYPDVATLARLEDGLRAVLWESD